MGLEEFLTVVATRSQATRALAAASHRARSARRASPRAPVRHPAPRYAIMARPP
jgi:hypothetical protein